METIYLPEVPEDGDFVSIKLRIACAIARLRTLSAYVEKFYQESEVKI